MDGKMVSAASAMLMSTGCAAPPGPAEPLDLIDGGPREVVGLRAGVTASFDGDDLLTSDARGTRTRYRARTPAKLYLSPDGDFLAPNFGGGSGQVYNLAMYRSRTGARVRSRISGEVSSSARGRGCAAAEDTFSILFEGWRAPDKALVQTEDWTRLEGCDALNGAWLIEPGGKAVFAVAAGS